MGLFERIRRLLGGGSGEPMVPAVSPGDAGGGGRGIEELSRRLGLGAEALLALRPSYRRFNLRKRSGGARRIADPSAELKLAQRHILRRLLARLRAHSAAHGFERGRSIVSNALPHAGKAVVVRMDLERFFESTDARKVHAFFQAVGWDRQTSALLTLLTTLDGALPQGAPTSPRLSNLVNLRLDTRLAGLAGKLGADYTRYADDLTFSFATDERSTVHQLIRAVKRITEGEGYRLHQRRKLRIQRRHDRQLVTGLVVNRAPSLPRELRRRLRAVEHRLASGRESTLSPSQLAGWRSFRAMVAGQGG